jgi:hypothetical protein
MIRAGTPKQLAAPGPRLLRLLDSDIGLLVILIFLPDVGPKPTSSRGCLTV